MGSFAVVVTHNRQQLLRECVAAIGPQVDTVIVIDNASDPPVRIADILFPEGPQRGHGTVLVSAADQPVNLPRLWNRGIGIAEKLFLTTEDPWHIAVLCDDAIVPPGWFDAVVKAMADTGASVGCSSPWGHDMPPTLKTAPDSDLMGRMTGWAWVLDPRTAVRPDPAMAFWWCDTDIDWQARHGGGMVMIGGYPVENRLPNDHLTHIPGLAEQSGRDGEAFVAKWGLRPW